MNGGTVPPSVPSGNSLRHPPTRVALAATKLLLGCYLGVSVLTLLVIILLRDDTTAVTDTVWVRASVVVISALVTFVCAVRAARGSRPAYRRVRLISGIMVVAIVILIAIPGALPLWMKIEQGACALLLLGVVVLVNGRRVRALFRAE